jgi:hypothetical protein
MSKIFLSSNLILYSSVKCSIIYENITNNSIINNKDNQFKKNIIHVKRNISLLIDRLFFICGSYILDYDID